MVQKYLKTYDYKYKESSKEIVLPKKRKAERIRLITSYIENNQKWEKHFFDKKILCLDGLDDFRSYTLKSRRLIRQKRQCAGGGLMIWMMFILN